MIVWYLVTNFCFFFRVEYFDKALDDDASEVTFYRRFAMLLDVVFGDLSIKMIE